MKFGKPKPGKKIEKLSGNPDIYKKKVSNPRTSFSKGGKFKTT